MANSIGKQHILYEIKAGDNLSKIAERFGTTPQELASIEDNHITDINKIEKGATLYIPVRTNFYTIKKGDTGSAIARRFGFTLTELAQVPENQKYIDVAAAQGKSPFSVLEVGDVIGFPKTELTLSDGSSMIAPPADSASQHNGSASVFGTVSQYADQLQSYADRTDMDDFPEKYESDGDVDMAVDGDYAAEECVDEDDGLAEAESWYEAPDYESYSEEDPVMTAVSDEVSLPWYLDESLFQSSEPVSEAPQVVATTLSAADPHYISKALEEIQSSSNDFLSEGLKELRRISRTNGTQSSEYADVRQHLREDLRLYAPNDTSLLLFLDTLLDMQELEVETLVSYAQKTDEIFAAFAKDPGFAPANRGSNTAKTEFVFSFLRERVTEQEDAFRFGAENTSHLEVGMEHLLDLVTSNEAKSIGYCSVCAQNIGMILARFNVPVNYHYGYVTEHIQFGRKTREGFVPDEGQEEPVASKASSELHVWLEVDGVEWEATSLRTVEEMVSKAYIFRNRRSRDKKTIGYKRIDHYEYTDTSGAVGMVENAMGMAQNARVILEEQRVGEYEALSERLPLGIQEDPELVELYQYAGKVTLEMARNQDRPVSTKRSSEEVEQLYAQACRYYAQGIEKAQAYTTRKAFIKQGLMAALNMANDVSGEEMQITGLRRILRLASEYLEPHEFASVIAAQSQSMPVTNGVLYAFDMLRAEESDEHRYQSVWSLDEQNKLMTSLFRAAEGIKGFKHWDVLADVFDKHSQGNRLWRDGSTVVAAAQEHASIDVLADASE
jgi:LysM repeat protein